MEDSLYIAVDLGAGSGRLFLCGFAADEMLQEEARRFTYPPRHIDGHLRWDVPHILDEIKLGLRDASARARELGRTVRSIGVDSWAIDYGFVDSSGELVELPVCYRDERTRGVKEEVFTIVNRAEVFRRTGVQLLDFNTLYQLYAHARTGIPIRAARLLMIPDLVNLFLTGRTVTEYTNATTTQAVDVRTGEWDYELLERLGLPTNLLPDIVPVGTDLGELRSSLAIELELDAARVVAPATHDTASAVAGAPLADGWAYISSGTWSLIGVERDAPLINDEVARHNFTNEGGAFGTIRFLKNVMGLWILEECRREWKDRGFDTDRDRLLRAASTLDRAPAFIYPDDPRFFNPASMTEVIADHLAAHGQHASDAPHIVTRIILDSLALRYASVLRTIEKLTNGKLVGVQLVGGGSRNVYLNQATADAAGLPVVAGPVEATVTGNALVQAITAHRFTSLSEARRHVADNIELKRYVPRFSPTWEDAARRYAAIESKYAN